ncbi:MAG: hypothetical protein ACR2NN_14835 [Bryobacteraceae bacterium]
MLRYIGTFMLGAALLAPMAAVAADDHDDRRDVRRYYDRDHRDYHQWNDDENQAYRRYLQEQRQDYREFNRMNRRQQAAYWQWRHEHQEHEHDRR